MRDDGLANQKNKKFFSSAAFHADNVTGQRGTQSSEPAPVDPSDL